MSIAKKAVKGTVFVAVSTYLTFGISFITSIILARFLVPEDFGIVALADFFLLLFARVKTFGFDHALMHKQDQLDEVLSIHFILQTSLAILTFIIVIIASVFFPKYYDPKMVTILLIFAFFSIFESMTSTPKVLLEKKLMYKQVTIFSVILTSIMSVIAIALAMWGYGVWSLVYPSAIGTIIAFIGYWILSPWKLSLKFDWELAKWLFKFGGILWIGGVMSFIVLQFDDFLVGTLVGVAALGFYSKAYHFSKLPLEMITHVVSRVAFPTYSKLQNNRKELSMAYTMVLSGILRLTIPMAIILFLIAPEFIVLLIGEKWLPMVPIFRMLIIYSLLRPIFDDGGSLCTAIGRPEIPTKLVTIQAVWVLLSAPLLTYFYGANGAAISVGIAMLIGVLLTYSKYLPKYIDISFRATFIPPIISIVAGLFVYLLLSQYITAPNMILIVAYKTSVVGLTYMAVLFLIERERLLREIKYIYELARS